MEKGNGERSSNNVPIWVKRDLQMLKRVSVSLVEMHRENLRRMAENKNILSELRQQTAAITRTSDIHSKAISELRQQTAAITRTSDIHSKAISELRQQTAAITRTSDIHSKAILKILKRI